MKIRASLLASLLLLVAGRVGADISSLSIALESPHLASDGVEVAGQTIRAGHLELQIEKGKIYPIVADGKSAGVWISGAGKFRYAPEDRLEVETVRTNVDRAGGLDVDRKGTISDTFTGALLLFAGPLSILPAGAEWKSGSKPPEEAVKGLAGHLERRRGDLGLHASSVVAQAIVEEDTPLVAVAEIDSRRRDLTWAMDPLRSGRESLWSLRQADQGVAVIRDLRIPDLLSSLPIGRGRLDPRTRRFVLTDVDVSIRNPGGLRAEIDARETFLFETPLRTLDLDLWSWRIGTVGANANLARNDYRLLSVIAPDGSKLPFSHRGGDLVIQFPVRFAAGRSLTLQFRMEGDVLFTPGNDSYWELPQSGWLPLPERLDMRSFRYHMTCRVPKPFVPFSGGKTVRRAEEGDDAILETRMDRPIQLVTVLAGKYSTTRETRGALTISVSTYAFADEENKKRMVDRVFSIVEFFKPFFGDYPYDELSVVEMNDLGYGVAPAGLLFITKEAFTPLQSEATRFFSGGVNGRVAHEVAHSWWGNHVALGQPEDEWMSESIAEYFSAVAISKLRGEDEMDKARALWLRTCRTGRKSSSVFLANELSGTEAFLDRSGLLYGKGPLVLDALRKKVGDQAFFTIFKSYASTFGGVPAETRHFLGLTKAVAKQDLAGWFDSYLFGLEMP